MLIKGMGIQQVSQVNGLAVSSPIVGSAWR